MTTLLNFVFAVEQVTGSNPHYQLGNLNGPGFYAA
jgi:hypothetical protein